MITTTGNKVRVTTRVFIHRDLWQRLMGHAISRGKIDEQMIRIFLDLDNQKKKKRLKSGKHRADVNCQKEK